MSKLQEIKTLVVHMIVPFADLKSFISLASTNKMFFGLFRSEFVWNILHARDHPLLAQNQLTSSIRAQFLAIRALVGSDELASSTPTAANMKEALGRLTALQSLLLECDGWQDTTYPQG